MVDATPEEYKLFNLLKDTYRNNKLALIIRVLQLESNPRSILDKIDYSIFKDVLSIDEIENTLEFNDYSLDVVELVNSISVPSKIKSARYIIEKLISENKSVIVWGIFIDSITNLHDYFNSIGISAEMIIGSTHTTDRERIIKNFQSGTLKLLITNPHTLAESVSLHNVCHDAVYYEYSYNLVHLLQSKDRIHRLGLKDDAYTQYHFICQNFKSISLDKRIYDRLQEKETNMLDAIDNNVLENEFTTQDDIDFILKDFFNEF